MTTEKDMLRIEYKDAIESMIELACAELKENRIKSAYAILQRALSYLEKL